MLKSNKFIKQQLNLSSFWKTSFVRSVAYALVHSWRLVVGYLPFVLFGLLKKPKRTIPLMIAYLLVQKTNTWRSLIHRFIDFGSSRRPKFVPCQTKPFDPKKQYLCCLHPHGILVCGFYNLISRFGKDFTSDSFELMDGLRIVLCFAPAVQHFPLHGEMYGNRVFDASASTIRRILNDKKEGLSVALSPGGFSEAVYTGASSKYEYSYLKSRKGFIKIAIEAGVDIIPTYSFGIDSMYHTLSPGRHIRAKIAQKTGLPLVAWWGKYGTSIPLHENHVTATFDPFPSSQYTIDQLDQCHSDYLIYLKQCFDDHKVKVGYGHKTLVFIGKDTPPPATSNDNDANINVTARL